MPVDSYDPYHTQESAQPSMGIQHRQGPLTMDQINWLLGRLSSDDQAELMQSSKRCLYNVALTMGVPLSLAVTGGLYYARSYLNLTKKGMPFYASVGVLTLFASNLFLGRRCGETLKPRLAELYDKYRLATPDSTALSYNAIRQAHRSAGLSQQPAGAESTFDDSYSAMNARERRGDETATGSGRPSPPRSIDFAANEPTLMSGTPYYPTGGDGFHMGEQEESDGTQRRTNFGGVEFS